jgi:hypothetical protein
MRPRLLTRMPLSFAQARMPLLRRRAAGGARSLARTVWPSGASEFDEWRELPTECEGVLAAQIDFILPAIETELEGLVCRTSVKIVFKRDRNPRSHMTPRFAGDSLSAPGKYIGAEKRLTRHSPHLCRRSRLPYSVAFCKAPESPRTH